MDRIRYENCMRTMKYLQKKSLGIVSYLQKSWLAEFECSMSGFPAKSSGGHAKQLLHKAVRIFVELSVRQDSCDLPRHSRSPGCKCCCVGNSRDKGCET